MLDKLSFTYKICISILILLLVWIITPTVAELIVAFWNSFQVYPSGTDTSMLASWLITQSVIIFIAIAVVLRYILRINTLVSILSGLVLACLMGWLIQVFPSFVPDSWCEQELKIYSCSTIYNNIDIIN